MTTLGDTIINAVIKAKALVGAEVTGTSVIFLWSANAAEQIEAAMQDPFAEINEQIQTLRAELAYVTLQRDALLEMTWLDLPDEPSESVKRWKEQFEKGWERKEK